MSEDTALSDLPALFDRVQQSVKPSKPFVVGSLRVTYGELFDRIRPLATLYHRAELRQGDRVVIASDDDLAAITLFMSVLRYGATAVVLDPQAPPDVLAASVAAARPRLLFLDPVVVGRLRIKASSFDGAAVITIGTGEGASGGSLFGRLAPGFSRPSPGGSIYPSVLKDVPSARRLPEELPASTVAYTLLIPAAGPELEGLELTHRQLFAQTSIFVAQYGFDRETRLLNVLPLHHPEAMTQGAVAAFAAGATLYRPLPFRTETLHALLDCIRTSRITHFATAPSILPLILTFVPDHQGAFATGDFRFVISTAAQLDASLREKFEAHFQTRIVPFRPPSPEPPRPRLVAG